ncbi:immunity 22 family protein [Pseudomonas purpurea]|uniref:immunity 22 family protein n=1 Tax=Pseudomonas purpurea TaxID=3136737 RepID=UPI0032632848
MNVTKTVSIWIANTHWDITTLQEVVSPSYSEDGDSLGSAFTRAFSLGFIDDDLIEIDIIKPTYSLAEAITGCSYDTALLSAINSRPAHLHPVTIDTIVLIYDHEAPVTLETNTIRDKQFLHVGKFKYSEK